MVRRSSGVRTEGSMGRRGQIIYARREPATNSKTFRDHRTNDQPLGSAPWDATNRPWRVRRRRMRPLDHQMEGRADRRTPPGRRDRELGEKPARDGNGEPPGGRTRPDDGRDHPHRRRCRGDRRRRRRLEVPSLGASTEGGGGGGRRRGRPGEGRRGGADTEGDRQRGPR